MAETIPLAGPTDFRLWERAVLEHFARTAADENKQLREDLRAALDAYRKEIIARELPCPNT